MTRAEAQRDEALKRSGAESSCACCVWVIFCVQSGLWTLEDAYIPFSHHSHKPELLKLCLFVLSP